MYPVKIIILYKQESKVCLRQGHAYFYDTGPDGAVVMSSTNRLNWLVLCRI